MIKSFIGLIVGVFLVALLLTGCGSFNDNEDSNTLFAATNEEDARGIENDFRIDKSLIPPNISTGPVILQDGTTVEVGVLVLKAHFLPVVVDEDEVLLEVVVARGRIEDEWFIALNTCENCHGTGRGYFVQYNVTQLACQQCQMLFPIADMGLSFGGCHPIPIEFTIKDDFIIFSHEALSENAHWFLNWKN